MWAVKSEQRFYMMNLAKTCMQLGEIKLLVVAVEVGMDQHTLYRADKAYMPARVARKDRLHQNRTLIITSNKYTSGYRQYSLYAVHESVDVFTIEGFYERRMKDISGFCKVFLNMFLLFWLDILKDGKY